MGCEEQAGQLFIYFIKWSYNEYKLSYNVRQCFFRLPERLPEQLPVQVSGIAFSCIIIRTVLSPSSGAAVYCTIPGGNDHKQHCRNWKKTLTL